MFAVQFLDAGHRDTLSVISTVIAISEFQNRLFCSNHIYSRPTGIAISEFVNRLFRCNHIYRRPTVIAISEFLIRLFRCHHIYRHAPLTPDYTVTVAYVHCCVSYSILQYHLSINTHRHRCKTNVDTQNRNDKRCCRQISKIIKTK